MDPLEALNLELESKAVAHEIGVQLYRYAHQDPTLVDALAVVMDGFGTSLLAEEMGQPESKIERITDLRHAVVEGYAMAIMREAAERHYDRTHPGEADEKLG